MVLPRFITYPLRLFGDAGVDPVVIESRADEIVGPVSTNEHKALVGHLGGMRRNWVFHALGLSAPHRLAEVKLAEGQSIRAASVHQRCWNLKNRFPYKIYQQGISETNVVSLRVMHRT